MKRILSNDAMIGPGNRYRVNDCSLLAVFLADLQPEHRIERIIQLEQEEGQKKDHHDHDNDKNNGQEQQQQGPRSSSSRRSTGAGSSSMLRDPSYHAMLPINLSFMLGQGHVATTLKNFATDLMSSRTTSSLLPSSIRPPPAPMPVIEPIQSWSYKNTSLFIQSYVLACTSYDLSTSIMEGYDPRRIKDVLNIPDRYDIPMIVATGYEYINDDEQVEENATSSLITPRLNVEEMVFEDSFGSPWKE